MSIDCAFFGFLPADAEPRVSQAGNKWVRFRVGVGKDDAVQWVSVAVFGKAAEAAADLKKGDRVYIEGSIKVDSWRGNDGAEHIGREIAERSAAPPRAPRKASGGASERSFQRPNSFLRPLHERRYTPTTSQPPRQRDVQFYLRKFPLCRDRFVFPGRPPGGNLHR